MWCDHNNDDDNMGHSHRNLCSPAENTSITLRRNAPFASQLCVIAGKRLMSSDFGVTFLRESPPFWMCTHKRSLLKSIIFFLRPKFQLVCWRSFLWRDLIPNPKPTFFAKIWLPQVLNENHIPSSRTKNDKARTNHGGRPKKTPPKLGPEACKFDLPTETRGFCWGILGDTVISTVKQKKEDIPIFHWEGTNYTSSVGALKWNMLHNINMNKVVNLKFSSFQTLDAKS